MAKLEIESDAELSSAPSDLDDHSVDKPGVTTTISKAVSRANSKANKGTSKKRGREPVEDEITVAKVSKKVRSQQVNGTTTKVKAEEEETVGVSPRKQGRTPRKAKTEAISKQKVEIESEDSTSENQADSVTTPKSRRKKAKARVQKVEDEEVAEDGESATVKKVKKKRKTKEEKEAESMPLAPRTPGHKMFVGAHVSGAGGMFNLCVVNFYSDRLESAKQR